MPPKKGNQSLAVNTKGGNATSPQRKSPSPQPAKSPAQRVIQQSAYEESHSSNRSLNSNGRRSTNRKVTPQTHFADKPEKDGLAPSGIAVNRRCRDVAFLLLFAIYWAGMGLIAYVGIKNGALYQL